MRQASKLARHSKVVWEYNVIIIGIYGPKEVVRVLLPIHNVEIRSVLTDLPFVTDVEEFIRFDLCKHIIDHIPFKSSEPRIRGSLCVFQSSHFTLQVADILQGVS